MIEGDLLMLYDLAIVGGGPAGCSAAVTAASRNLNTILFDVGGFAPALRKAPRIENYLGLPGCSGKELMDTFVAHVKSGGTKIATEKILNIMKLNDHFMLAGPSKVYEARSVILALGVSHTAGLPGEGDLVGKGVSYCATCDGNFYKGRNIGVICTVPALWHEVEFLASIASHVTCWLTFEPAAVPVNVETRRKSPKKLTKTDDGILISDGTETIVDGLFILRETDPVSRLMPGLDMSGKQIVTGHAMETSVPGVFAAGDCTGSPFQINKAAGEGQQAVLGVVDYLRVTRS
jgi:thioredoxin reductase (NADPH)